MTETTVTQELITWELLPEDFKLPDDPVDDLDHLLLVDSLRELFYTADLLAPCTIVASNFGISVCVGGKTIVKAPDWMYIPFAKAILHERCRKSYTPHLEGDVPSVVMEFLSEKDNGEYDAEDGGKWWFYEKILQVPRYVIFEPTSGRLEVYQLNKSGKYSPQVPDTNDRYWIPSVNLFLGVWYGTEKERTGAFLRWWDDQGNMLLWWSEKSVEERLRAELLAEQERLRAINAELLAEQERLLAEQERLRATNAEQLADRLAARLRELGIEPDELS